MKKKILIGGILFIIVVCAIVYFFYENDYKTVEFGNNNIKSAESIKEYILNMSSYEADIRLEVNSNKTSNQYRLKQKYSDEKVFKQEVLEPNHIQGLVTTYDGRNLKIENTKIGLQKIYENYPYLFENSLCLYSFIEDYKKSNHAKYEEKEDMLIMQVKVETKNQYTIRKQLYINKNTLKPEKMEIEDMNQKIRVYILYNEIKINSVNKEEVLAIQL